MTQTTLERRMADRAAVDADVGALAQQITARIHAAMAEGLYPDGLTVNLSRALSVNQLVGQELAPPPPVEPTA